jgi:ATP:corrinoid adenosyltransferase
MNTRQRLARFREDWLCKAAAKAGQTVADFLAEKEASPEYARIRFQAEQAKLAPTVPRVVFDEATRKLKIIYGDRDPVVRRRKRKPTHTQLLIDDTERDPR